MLNCKRASQLASRAMDEKLSFWENITLNAHLTLCRGCTNFARQLQFSRKASRQSRTDLDLRLTDEARQRIAKTLNNKQGKSGS